MKNKNISFAEVLKKKNRSPQVEINKQGFRLLEMVQQFEECPDEDYTLYLGSIGLSQRSKQTSVRMFASKNTVDNQEQMFDSWIQKQSFLGNNKENIANQPRRLPQNDTIKFSASKRVILTSKGTQKPKMAPRTMGQLIRQTQQNIEQSNYYSGNTNIEMIKSNYSENQSKTKELKSPRMNKHTVEQINLDFQPQYKTVISQPAKSLPKQEITFKNFKQNQGLRKEFNKITEQKIQEVDAIFQASPKHSSQSNLINSKRHQMEPISTENIHNQIAEIAKKYLQDKYSSIENEDDQLLIDDSNKKPVVQQLKENIFTENYSEKIEKEDQEQKKRWEKAKNLLGGYLKNINNLKQPSNIANSAQPTNQMQQIPAHLQVGYSFSTNLVNQNEGNQQQPNQLVIDHIQQIKSEMPSVSRKIDESDDLHFRKKYINFEEITVPGQHIKNIQSIQFQGDRINDYQAKFEDNLPNNSYEAKLISSQQRKQNNELEMQVYVNQYQEKQEQIKEKDNLNNYVQIQEIICRAEKIDAKNDVKQSINAKMSMKEYQKPNQKLSIISNKSKTYLESVLDRPNIYQSNQSVMKVQQPITSTNQQLNRKEDAEPYASKLKLSEERPRQYQLTRDTSLSPYKSIRQVKESIINPIKSPSTEVITNVEQNVSNFSPNYVTPTYAVPTSKYTFANAGTYGMNSHNYYSPNSTYATYANTTNIQTPVYVNSTTYGISNRDSISSIPKLQENEREIGTYGPTKYEQTTNGSVQISKKVEVFSSINNNDQKHTIATYESKIIRNSKQRNYLSNLDIKESINIDEFKPKMVSIPKTKESIKQSFNKPVLGGPSSSHFNKSLKASLKQSINVGESNQFQFDF